LTDVVADWPDAVEVFPYQAPDLYAGEPIVLAGRLDGPLDRPFSVGVVGRAAGTPWSETVEIGPGAALGIAALWARRKIEHITDARVDGLSEDLIRKLVVGVALEHNLVSRYTSLVAVDKTPARAPAATSERRAAANMLPAGAVLGQFPQTASAAPLYRWLGMLLLALAVLAGLSVRRPLHRRFLQRLRRRLLRPLRSRVLPRLRRAECAS
jgi:Ca-activated chloride channel family protein